jgi:hypothetical protein
MSSAAGLTMLNSKLHAPAFAATADDRARISAVIATRHPAMRSSLSAALEGDPQVHLGAAGDLLDTMRLLRSFQPDIVLLDAGVLGDEGIRRLPLLRSAAPTTVFLVLGMGDHPAYAAYARRGLRTHGPGGRPAAAGHSGRRIGDDPTGFTIASPCGATDNIIQIQDFQLCARGVGSLWCESGERDDSLRTGIEHRCLQCICPLRGRARAHEKAR